MSNLGFNDFLDNSGSNDSGFSEFLGNEGFNDFNGFLGDFIQDRVDTFNAAQGEEYVEQQRKYEIVYFRSFNQLLLNGLNVKAAQELARLSVMTEFDLSEYRIPEIVEHDIF